MILFLLYMVGVYYTHTKIRREYGCRTDWWGLFVVCMVFWPVLLMSNLPED